MLCAVDVVWGVTQLDNIVYAVFQDSSVISMYTADTLSPVGNIHVKGMRNPNDIVVCRDDRQLYVADSPSCLWRVSADDHSYVNWLSTKSTANTFHVDTLSVTSRRLLVTSLDRPRIHQYSATDKQLLRVISLAEYVVRLGHSAETTHGTFVVSHRGTSQDERQCAVSDPFEF